MLKVKQEDIIEVIRKAKLIFDPSKLRDDIKLSDQGMDSLDFFNLILLLQEKYAIKIPDSDIDLLSTTSLIVNYLNDRLVNDE